MRAFVCRVLIVSLVALFAVPSADAGGWAPSPYVTVAPGYRTAFHRVCVSDSFYACWTEPYGSRFCGCWPGGDHPACPIGYFFGCAQAPNGPPACGCY
jgi:hypothetical protein